MLVLGHNMSRLKKAFGSRKDEASGNEQSTELSERIICAVDQPFFEDEPTISAALKDLVPNASSVSRYLRNLFPCITWIPRYNLQWLLGDCIAGLTVGLVVIPQAMAYALLATLSPDFGLYTSFAGAATYWLFGTSKDIVIGVSNVCRTVIFVVLIEFSDDRRRFPPRGRGHYPCARSTSG